MLQNMLLAEIVVYRKDPATRSVNYITQEMLGFANLNLLRSLDRPGRKHRFGTLKGYGCVTRGDFRFNVGAEGH